MRALQDPLFRGLLVARHQQVTPAQHALLSTRILGHHGNVGLHLDQPAWADVIFITTGKIIAHTT